MYKIYNLSGEVGAACIKPLPPYPWWKILPGANTMGGDVEMTGLDMFEHFPNVGIQYPTSCPGFSNFTVRKLHKSAAKISVGYLRDRHDFKSWLKEMVLPGT